MKRLNWLFVFLVSFLFVSCEADIDTEFQKLFETENPVMITFDQGDVATRAGEIYYNPPTLKTGDKMGIFSLSNGSMSELKLYTVVKTNGSYTLEEPLEYQNTTHPHTFYCYFPDHSASVDDPEKVPARSVFSEQHQYGTSPDHEKEMEFYVTSPATISPEGGELRLNLRRVFTRIDFRINTNADGLMVDSIKLVAPSDKVIAYKSGMVNITLPANNSSFLKIFNFVDPGNKIVLNLHNYPVIPNSTTEYVTAHMVINPFSAYREKINIEVFTNKGLYKFEVDGDMYIASLIHTIPLRIEVEEEPEPELKEVYVLSMCEVGCLGEGDNTMTANDFGATCHTVHAKAMRRLLWEHFGPEKTVKTGTIHFEVAGHKHANTSCCKSKGDVYRDYNSFKKEDLEKYNIIFMNYDTRPTPEFSRLVIEWLQEKEDRVLMLAYDWKDYYIKSNTAEKTVLGKKATNYYLLKQPHIEQDIKPHWYNGGCIAKPNGDYGGIRYNMLIPFIFNQKNSYFWQDGPFTSSTFANTFSCTPDPLPQADQYYWINDMYWGSADILNSDVIPLVTYTDHRRVADPSKYAYSNICYPPDGGMVLGLNPNKRIVYIGDSELFSVWDTNGCYSATKQKSRIPYNSNPNVTVELNNYGKIMGNLWAWMIDEVIQKN